MYYTPAAPWPVEDLVELMTLSERSIKSIGKASTCARSRGAAVVGNKHVCACVICTMQSDTHGDFEQKDSHVSSQMPLKASAVAGAPHA